MRTVIITLVAAVFFIAVGCNDLIISPREPCNTIEDFKTTWNAIDSVYPLLEYKKIDWDSIYTIYRPLAEQARGDEMQELVYRLLAELKDAHIQYISNGGGLAFPYIPSRMIRSQNSYDPLLVRTYFSTDLKLACRNKVEYGITDNNTAYIYISGFDGAGLMDDFDIVMDYIKNSRGLIIDVRRNTGGWRENYSRVIGRFIDIPLEFPKGYTKGEVPYDSPVIKPDTLHYRYAKPVVVIINGASLSAGETFAEFMKQRPSVTVIGETTAGGGVVDLRDENIQGEYMLSCGSKIVIGTTYITRYDGVPVEWNGVAPDIFVPQNPEDIKNNQDRQLEYALELLK